MCVGSSVGLHGDRADGVMLLGLCVCGGEHRKLICMNGRIERSGCVSMGAGKCMTRPTLCRECEMEGLWLGFCSDSIGVISSCLCIGQSFRGLCDQAHSV